MRGVATAAAAAAAAVVVVVVVAAAAAAVVGLLAATQELVQRAERRGRRCQVGEASPVVVDVPLGNHRGQGAPANRRLRDG